MNSVNTYIFTPACFSCAYLVAATATTRAGNKLAPSVHVATGFREVIHCSAHDASHAGFQLEARKETCYFIYNSRASAVLSFDRWLARHWIGDMSRSKGPLRFTCASQERAQLQIQ